MLGSILFSGLFSAGAKSPAAEKTYHCDKDPYRKLQRAYYLSLHSGIPQLPCAFAENSETLSILIIYSSTRRFAHLNAFQPTEER